MRQLKRVTLEELMEELGRELGPGTPVSTEEARANLAMAARETYRVVRGAFDRENIRFGKVLDVAFDITQSEPPGPVAAVSGLVVSATCNYLTALHARDPEVFKKDFIQALDDSIMFLTRRFEKPNDTSTEQSPQGGPSEPHETT